MKKTLFGIVACLLMAVLISGFSKVHALIEGPFVVTDTLPGGDSVMIEHMMQKLTDSLALTTDQQQQISSMCYMIDSCKLAILSSYIGQPDSLGLYLTQLEYARDSSFMNVLSESQYRIYGQKKDALVLNN